MTGASCKKRTAGMDMHQCSLSVVFAVVAHAGALELLAGRVLIEMLVQQCSCCQSSSGI